MVHSVNRVTPEEATPTVTPKSDWLIRLGPEGADPEVERLHNQLCSALARLTWFGLAPLHRQAVGRFSGLPEPLQKLWQTRLAPPLSRGNLSQPTALLGSLCCVHDLWLVSNIGSRASDLSILD